MTMKPLPRLILAFASLLLVGMYFLPMWSISLDAPQYPEGLGMKIYINTVVGREENDLTNINGLNHYIGMKRIEPDSIPELRYMPLIIGVMIALGLLAAAFGRRWMALVWSVLFMVLGIVGITDFYMWEYDYGHNLDQHAAIVIPGMSYQPPLIGSKQLLNFTAHSYPDIAGYIAGIAILMGLVAWWLSRDAEHVRKRASKTPSIARWENEGGSTIARSMVVPAIIMFAVLTACEPKPEAIDWGKEECAHCKMNIADKRFAAQLLTTKGKAYKFDAIECLAGYINDKKITKSDIHSLWVMDYDNPGTFLPAQKSFFLQSLQFQSPMSLNLAAFANSKAVQAAQQKSGGKELYWDGVRLLVAKEWAPETPLQH
jgi:copper chaperone NosL